MEQDRAREDLYVGGSEEAVCGVGESGGSGSKGQSEPDRPSSCAEPLLAISVPKPEQYPSRQPISVYVCCCWLMLSLSWHDRHSSLSHNYVSQTHKTLCSNLLCSLSLSHTHHLSRLWLTIHLSLTQESLFETLWHNVWRARDECYGWKWGVGWLDGWYHRETRRGRVDGTRSGGRSMARAAWVGSAMASCSQVFCRNLRPISTSSVCSPPIALADMNRVVATCWMPSATGTAMSTSQCRA